MGLFVISFIAGVLTILAPCILPLLPVIVGRSISDTTLSKRRLFIVVLSLGLSVILFTLILKVSTLFINVPQDFWKWISGGIIFLFGIVTLFPDLWENIGFTGLISQKSNKVLMAGYKKNNVWGDVIVGASLGPIFSACSPTYFVILATVLPVHPLLGIFYLVTYTFGLSLALLLAALLGQKIVARLGFAMDSHGWFKRILGIIFILVSIFILTGYDKKLQVSILDAGFLDVTKIEQGLLGSNSKDEGAETEKKKFTVAPELRDIEGYINTDGKPITIGEFKGKSVVLLDIWTYSCINCQRTIPYLNEWYKKYKDQGLVIIGLSDPEFAFEHILKNVEEAVKNFGIQYPVALDNNFSTWHAYKNQYWPRDYLIDIDGYIVHSHAGEGDYEETEKAIQSALSERNIRLGITAPMDTTIANPADQIKVDPGKINSPEIYFGSERNTYLANGRQGSSGLQDLKIPKGIDLNSLYLGGKWNITSEYAENIGDGNIVFKYRAKNVYMVASSEDGADVEVYLDGKLSNTVHIKDEKLYSIISGSDYGEHTLMLRIKSPGVEAYTFTFG